MRDGPRSRCASPACSSRSTSRTSCGRISSRVLRAQRQVATGTEAVELLSRIATIEEAELAGARHRVRRAGSRCSGSIRRTSARASSSRGSRSSSSAGPRRPRPSRPRRPRRPRATSSPARALLGELAAYYDIQLGDAPRAIAAYRRWLEVDPSNPTTVRRVDDRARAALRGGRARGPSCAASCASRPSGPRTRASGARCSRASRQLEEEQARRPRRRDRDVARRARPISPTDAGALDALERLYQATEQLARADRRPAPQARSRGGATRPSEHARRGSPRSTRSMLEEPDEAIAAHLEILDRDAERRRARSASSRGCTARRSATPICSTSSSARRSSTPGRARRAPRRDRAAARRPARAPGRGARALGAGPRRRMPSTRDAIAAVEAALDDLDLRVAAADILRPVYDGTGQHAAARGAPAPRRRVDRRPRGEAARARRGRAAPRVPARRQGRRVRRPAAGAPARRDRARAAAGGRRGRAARRRARPRGRPDRRVPRGRAERARRRDPAPALPRRRRPRARACASDLALAARVLPEGPRRRSPTIAARSPRSRASTARPNDHERARPRSCCARPMSPTPTSTSASARSSRPPGSTSS